MPELPEVETVKKVITPIVINRRILSIDVLRKTIIQNEPKEDFVNSLIGETFLSISRIGKFLIFHLSHDKVMISHLRMEGKYFDVLEKEENSKYARVVFHLDNGHKLCYDDSRTFGILKLTTEQDYLKEKEIAQLGPEPFKADAKEIYKQVKKSSLPIKSTLLDQTLMTGLGNIYVDEVLFASKIHPLTPAKDITLKEWEVIIANAIRILNNAIEEGGSTIRSYHPGKGIDGNFQTALKAYGKGGEKCPDCGHYFRFIKVGGRGTTFCPNCQPRRGGPLSIAIYGRSGSGKSEVLKAFKDRGYATISSDDIVHVLYKKPEVISLINKTFNQGFAGEIDRDVFRNYLKDNPKMVNKLNRLIHPLVKKEVERFLKEEKSSLLVVEVPLLFEAKMENMFDILLAVDVNEKTQLARLKERNPSSAIDIKQINSYSKFDEYKEKADVVINNNADLIKLNKEIDKLINKWQSRLN
ncbi:MAG: DNA-formamidopyrimidine glycosylase [Bacilli bacterium]|nr:DNA-formamidopyrimidine glycosylase [Bacilli bacterium]